MIKLFPKTACITKKTKLLAFSLCALLLCTVTQAEMTSESLLKPYQAKYRITQNNLSADASRKLAKVGPHWRLSQTASKWFITIGEESLIEVTENQNLRPLQYRYENSLSSKRDQRIVFDWEANKASDETYRKPYTLPLKADYADQLSAQLQLRQQLLNGQAQDKRWQQTIVKNGKIKTYQIEKLTEETIDTELGPIDTVKLRRKREGSSAETFIWLAKEWNYMIVKLVQTEDDDSLSLELISATIDGSPMRAAR